MLNPNTWTPNSMEVGVANCNPDVANENLEYLKYEIDQVTLNSVIIQLGTVSSGNATLTKDRIHSLTIGGACSIVAPSTGMVSGTISNFEIRLKMNSIVSVNWPTNMTWVDGSGPQLTSTTAKYIIVLESEDGGTTLSGYYTKIGT